MASQRMKLVLQDLFRAIDVSLISSDSIYAGLQAATDILDTEIKG